MPELQSPDRASRRRPGQASPDRRQSGDGKPAPRNRRAVAIDIIKTLIAGAVAIGLATAVLLPDRQTVPVLGAATKFTTGTLNTAIKG